ncbi:MAG: C4-type zinc ribbon domain-containing protein [Verrucomicrobiota bacterium]|nr:C4-type zinc ribbon domain-containing protein [Verrucomicrobiota bacterium]MEE2942942.1 C4-type zinc ribbon domain-containing protein [Verrucomicrobiota bacterium]
MNEEIRQLLVLQDRDSKAARLEVELESIDPEREKTKRESLASQQVLEQAKQAKMQLEVRRKDLENEVESKKEQIRKYSQQQLETKKNEEYQALTREIEHVRQSISELEDQELELMEEQDDFKAKLAEASQVAEEAKVNEAQLLSELDEREKNLGSQLDQLDEEREALADAIDPKALAHYERLLDTKGGRVIVGIDHGSCGGCHMKLQAQEIVNAKSERERITCTNCGRLLYYTREMVLANELED